MRVIKKIPGKVKNFETAFTSDVEKWQTNPKCRSFRIRNTGQKSIIVKFGSVTETLETDDSVTYGGYPDSNRDDSLSVTFSGGAGLTQRFVIAQDIQVKDPKFLVYEPTETELNQILNDC